MTSSWHAVVGVAGAVAGAAVVFGAEACGTYGDGETVSDDAAISPERDAGGAKGADAAQADAAVGARHCATRLPCAGTLLVENAFDQIDAGEWTTEGTIFRNTTEFVSPPSSVEAVLAASDFGQIQRRIDLPQANGTTLCLEVCAHLDYDNAAFGPDPNMDFAALIDVNAFGADREKLVGFLEVGAGREDYVYIYATGAEPPWKDARLLPGKIPHERWTHLRLEVTWQAPARMNLWVDGVGVVTAMAAPLASAPASLEVVLGAHTTGTSPRVRARYDDLRVTGR